MPFFIRSVVGQGGSCLVYDGYYENNAGGKSTVRIKECYPYMLSMERNSQGGLMITQKSQRKQFELYKKRFRDSFVVISELHEMAGLTNYTSQVYDLYEKNGTLYTVSSYVEGNTLDRIQFSSIREVLLVVMNTGKKEQCLIHKMLRAVDKSINCMKRAGGKEAERLVVKYTYGKIFLLIRCMPERDLKIKRLIIEMEKVLKRDGSYRMEFQFLHYMARAWYFTLCREKAEQVLYNLKRRENVRSLMADRIWTKSIIGSSRGRIFCLNWGREIRPRSGLRKEKPCVRRIRRNFPL